MPRPEPALLTDEFDDEVGGVHPEIVGQPGVPIGVDLVAKFSRGCSAGWC
jgi:hypothetical protein